MDLVGTPQLLEGSRDEPQSPLLRRFRNARVLRWLGHRGSFAIGMPLLSALGLATSLYIPRLVSPAEFGAYALLFNLFRYAGRCDLGLTQLADRLLAVPNPNANEGWSLLEVRIRLGMIVLCAAVPIVTIIAHLLGLSRIDAMIAVTAGLCAMVAGGPSTIFRAQGRIWEYTALAFLFAFGFIVPRLIGFVMGGVTGCFVLWLVWYGAMAGFLTWSIRNVRVPQISMGGAIRASLPLFVFAGTWSIYLTVDRWVAAALSSPHDLGLFALGANLATAAVITVSQVSDLRYPRWLKMIGAGRPFEFARSIETEALVIGATVSALVAMGIPFINDAVLLFFPAYGGAAGPMMGFAAACAPTIIVAWFLPVAIARSKRPFIDTVLLFLPASLSMGIGMIVGNRIAGIDGQAWACCVSASVLLGGLTLVLRRSAVLNTPSALRIAGASLLMLLALAAVAFTARSTEARTGAPATVPPAHWSRVFSEHFAEPSFWNGQSGIWQTSYVGGQRTNVSNAELEFYASPDDHAFPSSLQPFVSGTGGLQITARQVPLADRAATGHHAFVSGLLNSAHSFAFTYGYAVMHARLPRGRGLWPAFWLLPTTGHDPPELDVMEMLGDRPTQYYATLHSRSGVSMHKIETVPLDQGFHDYGVLWTQTSITWFLDGVAVASAPTPTDMHGPMYLLVNLAVGGKWPGSPDANTEFPAHMQIASIDVYQEPADKTSVPREAKEFVR